MKVLFYNWCPINETEGGGIAVYQRNLLNYINVHEKDIEPSFLCSGFYYDGKSETYIREEKEEYGAKIYSVVNSPVYAPMRAPYDNFSTIINDQTLTKLLGNFIQEKGPFDAIHFQTLEGLSLSVLSLKKVFQRTQFVYSIHNYTAICPNVMMWTEKRTNCAVGKRECCCEECMNRYNRPGTNFLKKSRILLEYHQSRLYYYTRGIKYLMRHYLPVKKAKNEDIYNKYVEESIQNINRYMDTILAVSERVKEVVIDRGINEKKIKVSYIGTSFAEKAIKKSLTDPHIDPFGIVYMGYMREEKGFFFFLSALERLEEKISKNVKITFATRIENLKTRKRIDSLKTKYAEVRLFDGYKHSEIPQILKGAHLGIVPVLWEDNLPQVAIEMISNGVPVLASSYGGASELNDKKEFKFSGNNTEDLLKKIIAIFEHRELLTEYWQYKKDLTTMQKHVEELQHAYLV